MFERKDGKFEKTSNIGTFFGGKRNRNVALYDLSNEYTILKLQNIRVKKDF
jgi:hypothetical protein